jgi:hypothetical protein
MVGEKLSSLKERAIRPFGARVVVVAAGSGALAAAVAVAACIADLPPNGPAATAAAVSAATSCDDGYIDLSIGEQCDPGPTAGDAGLAGCSDQCKMLCPEGFVWPQNNHCYESAAGSADTLDMEAVNRCAAMGGHVVTFASEAEFQAVSQSFDVGGFWVGLAPSDPPYDSVVAYEPGWSTTCSGCFAHTADPTQALARFDADPDSGTEDCVQGVTGADAGPWLKYACTGGAALHVLCEREPVGFQSQQCDAGVCIDLVATFGTKRYVYQDEPASPDAAQQACQSLGGRLVTLDSRDEREQLWLELSKLTEAVSPTAIWIGLSVGADGGSAWTWDDGEPLDARPSPWGDREPHAPSTTTSPRAYLEHFATPPLDDTLARNEGPVATLPFVCEILVAQDP